jgi:hypothetical protein
MKEYFGSGVVSFTLRPLYQVLFEHFGFPMPVIIPPVLFIHVIIIIIQD